MSAYPAPARDGRYIVEGDLLLTEHEWHRGDRPSDGVLASRRREVGRDSADKRTVAAVLSSAAEVMPAAERRVFRGILAGDLADPPEPPPQRKARARKASAHPRLL